MAKGKKTGGKDFPPGISGNPAGRPVTPEDLRVVKKMGQADFDANIRRLSELSAKEVKILADNLDTPALERALAKTLYLAGRSGDPRRLEVILNRTYGRTVPQKPDQADPGQRKTLAELSDNEIDKRIALLTKGKVSGRA